MKLSLSILLLTLSLRLSAPVYVDSTENAQEQLFYFEVYNVPFTTELLQIALKYENIEYPEIVFRQMQLETGNFTSDIFLTGNNLSGMKQPRVRETTAIGSYKNHALYSHWLDSVKDYRLWQLYYLNSGHSFEDYLAFLLYVGYAEDENYINKLKS